MIRGSQGEARMMVPSVLISKAARSGRSLALSRADLFVRPRWKGAQSSEVIWSGQVG